MSAQTLYQNIADYLFTTPEYIKEWVNTPVKYKLNPLNLSEFMMHFFRSLPIEDFNVSLKINRDWYKECLYELRRRHVVYKNKYWKIIEDLKKIGKEHKSWEDDRTVSEVINSPLYKKYCELYDKKSEVFKDWVAVEQALLRSGFIDISSIEYENISYHVRMLNDGFDPYEIPEPGELENEYWGDENSEDSEFENDYWDDEDPDI